MTEAEEATVAMEAVVAGETNTQENNALCTLSREDLYTGHTNIANPRV